MSKPKLTQQQRDDIIEAMTMDGVETAAPLSTLTDEQLLLLLAFELTSDLSD